jgi:D-arabinan exo alpha-(1,3)/(1,5)-arabinofuranosidase (non-reducing end)
MLRKIKLLILCLVMIMPAIASTKTMPGPFGILNLPANYESHRVSFRDRISVNSETVIADIEGEGCLRHFWITLHKIPTRPKVGIKMTLRVYVDGNEKPSVETPVSPFFGIHHATRAAYINAPFIQVTDRSGFNSYFPMPYVNGMRITMQSTDEPTMIWFQADYHKYKPNTLKEALRFHAAYRRVNPCQHYGNPYHLAHGTGRGRIVGMTLGMRVFDGNDSWYHCGGDQMLLDGRTERAHVLSGIGGEDFFGTAWGQDVFQNESIGTAYYDVIKEREEGDPKIVFGAWRFFDKDPIAFADSFWWDFGSLRNDISSVVYWYQEGVASPFVEYPTYQDRLPDATVPAGKYDLPFKSEMVWNLCGPFSCEDSAEFDRNEFPERGNDLQQTAPADFGQYREAARRKRGMPTTTAWKTGVGSTFNFVDLTPYFRARKTTNAGMPVQVSAYASTTINAKRAGRARIRVGHDDPLRIWINGQVVFDGKQQNGLQCSTIKVKLSKGDNAILVKSANFANSNFRAWVFLFDLLK